MTDPGKLERRKLFTILRIYAFMTSAFEEVIPRAQIIIYPRCGKVATKIGSRIPTSRLVARILTWSRTDGMSRTTTERRKRPTSESRNGENVFTIL